MFSILDLFYRWSQDNLDIVFFIYGLSFVVMGIAILIQPKKASKFKFANTLWLLAGFGLIHGVNEWLDMWAIIKGINPVFNIVRNLILVVSYLLLFEFGRQLFYAYKQKRLKGVAKLFSRYLTLIIGFMVFSFAYLSTDFWRAGAIWARYLLCLPGSLLTGLGFIRSYKYERKEVKHLKVKKYFFLGGVFFFIYGIVGGLIVPDIGLPPSSWINADSFFSLTQIPVQIFRAICAIIIAWAVYRILAIFNWEMKAGLQKEITARSKAQEVLAKAYADLEIRIQERTKELAKTNKALRAEINQGEQTREENKRNYDIQKVLNQLLNFSLKTVSIDEVLEYALDLVFSISWISFKSKGSIFLVGDDPQVLVMRVQRGISDFLQKSCARIPFGKCLCGQAALTKKIQFVDHLDKRHEIRYASITPHGHYCVPIIFSDKVLGVLNVYIKEKHVYSQREEGFLAAVANVLAGVIERKKSEDELKMAYIKLKETQDQLIQSEKLNAVGLLASGVAHEVRNPLGIIIQGTNYLEKKIPAKEKDVFETLAALKDSVKRTDKVISGLLDFSKNTILNLHSEDINSILEKSLSLVKTQFKFEHIEIIKELKTDIPKVWVDKINIEQVCINILLNAAQAMPKGGKIIIRTYYKRIREKEDGTGEGDEDYFRIGEKAVIVEFEDTGVGISEENINKIFDPFFTSKELKGGTGLGLSVSRSIIHMHKGLMYAESQVGKGTKITIILKIAGR
jgi:signal transduction histidine kinase